ncbi:Disks large-like 4 [Platysternon megacephalum]|uniref:Disks large-like 4 n=1 Tax=Platysternon megacephalum TaxID=55544 RepID=A0A4D9DRN1_9SAUR|nr:Disks large-like 4 [Platysternon megacephalum]
MLVKLAHACEVLFSVMGKVTLDQSQIKNLVTKQHPAGCPLEGVAEGVSSGCLQRVHTSGLMSCSDPAIQNPAVVMEHCSVECKPCPRSTLLQHTGVRPHLLQSQTLEKVELKVSVPGPHLAHWRGHRSALRACSTFLCSKPP